MYVKDAFQCEQCHGKEDAMALGDKRSTVKYEEDDTKAVHAANRNGPRKVRRLSTDQRFVDFSSLWVYTVIKEEGIPHSMRYQY